MLEDRQRQLLIDLVAGMVGWPINHTMGRDLVGQDHWSRAPAFSNATACGTWIVGVVLRHSDSSRFIDLVRTVDQAQTLPGLWSLVSEVQQEPALWAGSPARQLHVPHGWPFVDRDSVRERLVSLQAPSPTRAITIDAPEGHGKRTLCRLIEMLARGDTGFHPVIRPLREEPQQDALETLVDDLRHALGLGVDHGTTHEEPERQAEIYASNLALDATAATQTVWFVANVIEAGRLDPGIFTFLDRLLELTQDDALSLGEHLRIVLLADGVAGLGLEHLPPVEDRFVLTQVTEDHIVEWLEAAVPGRDDRLYRMAAQNVVRRADERAADRASRRLRWLSRFCDEASQTIRDY